MKVGLILILSLWTSVTMAAATSITFSVTPPRGYEVSIGNVVSPQTGMYWFSPGGGTRWVWVNNGNNVNAFALTFNFKKAGESEWRAVFKGVSVNPTQLPNNDVNVPVTFMTCRVNGVEALRVSQVPSTAEIVVLPSQPDCQE